MDSIKSVKADTKHFNRSIGVVLLLTLLLLLGETQLVLGGNCWLSMNRNGRCTSLIKSDVSREDCCESESLAEYHTVSWSEGELLTPSDVFYMHVQGGLPCTRCKNICDGVQCPENQKCVVRKGVPKCVCAPNCAALGLHNGLRNYRGNVCGTDGRTYQSPCRLLRRKCQNKERNLRIGYYGPCKSSCKGVICPGKKQCVLDQNMKPNCVNCPRRKCPVPLKSRPNQPICGVDRVTYDSICELRQHACRLGKAIPVAYKGLCIRKATCTTVKCLQGQACLQELNSERPRCVTCTFQPSWCNTTMGTSEEPLGPICSTNGKTYKNWCDMTKEACMIGIALDTQHFGGCRTNSTVQIKEQIEN